MRGMNGLASGDRHFPPDNRLFGIGLAVVAMLYLTISAMTLLNFGFNYDEAGGSVFEKIHPATFVAIAVLIAALLARAIR